MKWRGAHISNRDSSTCPVKKPGKPYFCMCIILPVPISHSYNTWVVRVSVECWSFIEISAKFHQPRCQATYRPAGKDSELSVALAAAGPPTLFHRISSILRILPKIELARTSQLRKRQLAVPLSQRSRYQFLSFANVRFFGNLIFSKNFDFNHTCVNFTQTCVTFKQTRVNFTQKCVTFTKKKVC